ncbi:uncharacterized protein PV09_09805 [Verruconis gallopava]|uniref:AP180 N-terminal homology (ANTH) domain-containing protein n=1 Tax=Verruconis gallopava TaxID=253628 RepID=A0A0D1X8L5_9PEZI|nr:uncharacterized protein PV09_09805 [Verruconis gallopava]KIV98355.1 hypothetical protein PV09_09805 [Verruconis gallopava]
MQNIVSALLRCGTLTSEPQSIIEITAFRLLATDLLKFFRNLQTDIIILLNNFFGLTRSQAKEILQIYRIFEEQMWKFTGYMMVARNYQPVTGFEVPTFDHIPTGLASQLEHYLDEKQLADSPKQEVSFDQHCAEDLIDCASETGDTLFVEL